MNRLLFSRTYLVGPMDFCREDGKVWRDELTEFLEEIGIIVLNPYKKPLHITHGRAMLEDDLHAQERDRLYKNEDYDGITKNMKPIRAVDLRMVDHADFLIAYLNFSVIMTGTIEEIITANREKKPIIVLSSTPKNKIPPWYFAMMPHSLFFQSLDEIKQYIKHIDSDEEIDTLNGRWVFFDLQKQIQEIYERQICKK